MAHGFRVVDREQQFLLPPDVRDWLPDEHLAWFVIEAVRELDLSDIEAGYRLGRAGRRAYHPAMMVTLLLYAYAIGVRSSRAIERSCETDVAFRVIAANEVPDHATIARFRARHADALAGLFTQVLELCVRAGLVDARVVAVDSTKVAADASLSANATREQLEEQASQILAEAARIDAEEDARYGKDRRGDEPAEGWQAGSDRAARIREALRQLDDQPDGQDQIDQRQAARVAAGKKKRGRPRLPADPAKPWRVASQAQHPQRKANVSDPDSRLMSSPHGWVQGYSAQAVATDGQIIVAADVTNDHNDNHALRPMLDLTLDNLSHVGVQQRPVVILADRGYWDSREVHDIESDLAVTTLVATVKDRDLRSDDDIPDDPDQPSRTKMHRRFKHPCAQRLYRRRSPMIEPIFAQRKINRRLDRFLRRGLDAVRAEWSIEATAHNLTKLWRAQRAPA